MFDISARSLISYSHVVAVIQNVIAVIFSICMFPYNMHEFKVSLRILFDLQSQFEHPNVVGMYGCVTVGDPVLLVVEYCENGSLLSVIKHDPAPPLQMKLGFVLDIAQGMEYLATLNCVHRSPYNTAYPSLSILLGVARGVFISS